MTSFIESCQATERKDSEAVRTAVDNDVGESAHKIISLQIFGKNVQSLQTDAREDELLEELECFDWDVVLLNETWRSQKQERWTTKEGHMFCGSGGTEGSRGVAVMLNRRWTKGFKAVHNISDRICAVDVKIHGQVVRFISAYFPHGGYADEEVEAMYSNMDGLVDAARKRNWACVIFGDWNAVLGPGQDEDDPNSIGLHGIGQRNERGKWLARWATSQQLLVANTMFEKDPEHQWTHKNGNNKRQIDYFLICARRSSWVRNAYASEQIGVGRDHRAVHLELSLSAPGTSSSTRHQCKPQRIRKGWKPSDDKEYKAEVAASLHPVTNASNLQEACLQVETAVLDAGKKYQAKKSGNDKTDDESKSYLRELIQQRKDGRATGNRNAVTTTSKLIQKEMRRLNKINKAAKVTRVLQDFKELGRLADVRNKGKREYINSVIDKEGKECTSKADIAEVFAEFYESLYAKVDEYDYRVQEEVREASAVSKEEVREQLKRMKSNKAPDEEGIVAELLREGGEELLDVLAQIFTEVLRPGANVPSSWSSSSIRVLFKKGDRKIPGNYRPVCIIPILYKLFSRVVCERIKETLLAEQAEDQAGFRPGYGCEDHLFTITLLAEKSREFNVPLWIAAIDFSKAFDSISHRSIFEALREHNVPLAYIDVLTRLYKDQVATVRCDCKSRAFGICRGTKQGDPLSPYIFNSVLEQVLRPVQKSWRERKYGIVLDPNLQETLTNLRFADDILLIGRTLPQIKQMIADVMESCKKVGLSLHPEKTKIMHNARGYGSKVTKAKINGEEFEVLDGQSSTMYLGRLLTLTDTHDVELSHRIRKGWTKYGIFKQELTDKAVPVDLRLKLFHTVVTPTVLYGAGCWVMTGGREQALQTAQMRMMRSIVGRKRKVEASGDMETWLDWIKNATQEVRNKMSDLQIPLWTEMVCTKQSRWRSKMQTMKVESWAKRVSQWHPIGFRRQGRPPKRWKEEE